MSLVQVITTDPSLSSLTYPTNLRKGNTLVHVMATSGNTSIFTPNGFTNVPIIGNHVFRGDASSYVTGTTFTLTFNGYTTAAIPGLTFTKASLTAALEALPSIGANNVNVFPSSSGGDFYLEMVNALGGTSFTGALTASVSGGGTLSITNESAGGQEGSLRLSTTATGGYGVGNLYINKRTVDGTESGTLSVSQYAVVYELSNDILTPMFYRGLDFRTAASSPYSFGPLKTISSGLDFIAIASQWAASSETSYPASLQFNTSTNTMPTGYTTRLFGEVTQNVTSRFSNSPLPGYTYDRNMTFLSLADRYRTSLGTIAGGTYNAQAELDPGLARIIIPEKTDFVGWGTGV